MKTLADAADKAEILRRLHDVHPGLAARWGRMSAHQMVCHVADALDMSTGARAVTADMSLLRRTAIKWIVLYVPVRWPTGITTCPELDAERGGTRPSDFATDLARAVARVEGATTPISRARPQHPLFGTLSEAAWLRWAYLHMDHHLRQFGV